MCEADAVSLMIVGEKVRSCHFVVFIPNGCSLAIPNMLGCGSTKRIGLQEDNLSVGTAF